MDKMICRTMFCPKCYRANHPIAGDKFVVYGTHRETLHEKVAHQDGLPGYTPHLITFKVPEIYKDGKIELIVCCGVCEAGYTWKKQQIYFYFKEARYIYLPYDDFQALVLRWKNTGLELI